MSFPLRVIYEDERLLGVDKPSGQAVIPVRGPQAEAPLSEMLRKRLGAKPFVVHRLDRGTSGVVVFAKDARTHRELCGHFEARRVEKEYLALVSGAPPESGRLELPLREFASGRVAPDPRGKPSCTSFTLLEPLREASLLSLRPLTGRRHQLRAHLNAAGFPILGDPLYAPPQVRAAAPRLMLHARRLVLPLASGQVTLEAEPPEDFERLLASLRAPKGPGIS